jgi:hypothetical protein
MSFEYYYNNVPGHGKCRNNLIYTSLISHDRKTFVQWYYNDSDYHMGHNQVIDPMLMQEKWVREVNFLNQMRNYYPDLVPKVKLVDLIDKKIYLEIDGVDFWERSGCDQDNFDSVLPDWQDQMLNIIAKHNELGIYKMSMHPSSYFIVDGKLKSINYFFSYKKDEPDIMFSDIESHISDGRKELLIPKLKMFDLDIDKPLSLYKLQQLCFESFSNNYPRDFIEKAKKIYV